jgi:putative membrane protein
MSTLIKKTDATDKNALVAILFVSVVIVTFLAWLIYFKEAADRGTLEWISILPALNALLNTFCTVCLIRGLLLIKKGDKTGHRNMMLSALTLSALFLVSYVVYHHYQGDTKFINPGNIRYFYFFILITHITASIVVVPMIFTTVYFAATGNFIKHPKVARITFPIWLYVSSTGVLIFVMLKLFNYTS